MAPTGGPQQEERNPLCSGLLSPATAVPVNQCWREGCPTPPQREPVPSRPQVKAQMPHPQGSLVPFWEAGQGQGSPPVGAGILLPGVKELRSKDLALRDAVGTGSADGLDLIVPVMMQMVLLGRLSTELLPPQPSLLEPMERSAWLHFLPHTSWGGPTEHSWERDILGFLPVVSLKNVEVGGWEATPDDTHERLTPQLAKIVKS